MFDRLSGRLAGVFSALTKRGSLRESDVDEALQEVRRALLGADVALKVVKDFIGSVRRKAIGQDVLRSVTPGQQVIKIVHDEIIALLGGKDGEARIDLGASQPPLVVMLVGLQGAGKTTTAAKLAFHLCRGGGKKALLASLDTARPAAREQLNLLGEQVGAAVLPVVPGQSPVQIAERAGRAARLSGVDLLLLDTAGRTHVDGALMAEMAEMEKVAQPSEILLVADALTGQDALNVAESFSACVSLTGILLTRLDGEGGAGAALSMRAVTGKPIRYIGVGEKIDALEPFRPASIADRLLGMGDIVGLVEKAEREADAEKAQELARKLEGGKFDLEDLAKQLEQVQRLGGVTSLVGMLPGFLAGGRRSVPAGMDDLVLRRWVAIVRAMTPWERRNPDCLKASRKRRVAAGAGVKVEEVNRLLKVYRGMADAVKMMGKAKRGGRLRSTMASLTGFASSAGDAGSVAPGDPLERFPFLGVGRGKKLSAGRKKGKKR